VQTSLVCAGKPKNLPAAQSVQTAAPAAEYVPASAAGADVARLRWQTKELAGSAARCRPQAPAAEYVPATQLVQTSLVCAGKPKNLPAVQLVQTEAPAFAEYVPTVQLVQAAAPAAEYLPATQLVQTVLLVCAGEPKNLPAEQ
jgi:hypothetical protein